MLPVGYLSCGFSGWKILVNCKNSLYLILMGDYPLWLFLFINWLCQLSMLALLFL